MNTSRRPNWILKAGIAIAALALLFVTRRIQVLLIANDSPTLELSATVALGNEVRELGVVPPGAVGYVWANAPEREAEFKIDARWSDGSSRKLDACYVDLFPQVYSVHPTQAEGRLGCQMYPLPALGGIGIPYAAIRSLLSRL